MSRSCAAADRGLAGASTQPQLESEASPAQVCAQFCQSTATCIGEGGGGSGQRGVACGGEVLTPLPPPARSPPRDPPAVHGWRCPSSSSRTTRPSQCHTGERVTECNDGAEELPGGGVQRFVESPVAHPRRSDGPSTRLTRSSSRPAHLRARNTRVERVPSNGGAGAPHAALRRVARSRESVGRHGVARRSRGAALRRVPDANCSTQMLGTWWWRPPRCWRGTGSRGEASARHGAARGRGAVRPARRRARPSLRSDGAGAPRGVRSFEVHNVALAPAPTNTG